MMFRPGDGGIRTRAIAVLVADGTDVKDAFAWRTRLEAEGATVTFVGPRLGAVEAAGKQRLEVEQTFATAPAVTFDACVLAAGSSTALRPLAAANQFLQDIYRHGKTLATVDNCAPWLDAMGIDPDHTAGSGAGIFIAEGDRQSASLVDSFVRAVAGHRHWDRPVRTLRV
jgi:catalase